MSVYDGKVQSAAFRIHPGLLELSKAGNCRHGQTEDTRGCTGDRKHIEFVTGEQWEYGESTLSGTERLKAWAEPCAFLFQLLAQGTSWE
eukprot:6203352-Pleurochrysis_carterae.AAC.1